MDEEKHELREDYKMDKQMPEKEEQPRIEEEKFDEKVNKKGKRLIACLLLLAFLLLLINIFFIGYKRELSITIYLLIAFTFIMFNYRSS